jgi:hypothetical protein
MNARKPRPLWPLLTAALVGIPTPVNARMIQRVHEWTLESGRWTLGLREYRHTYRPKHGFTEIWLGRKKLTFEDVTAGQVFSLAGTVTAVLVVVVAFFVLNRRRKQFTA